MTALLPQKGMDAPTLRELAQQAMASVNALSDALDAAIPDSEGSGVIDASAGASCAAWVLERVYSELDACLPGEALVPQ